LEYRLLPEDLSKVVMAGGMQIDEDGWLKETSSMGRPLLVVLRNRDSAEFIGVTWTGEVDKLGLEPIIKSLIESDLVPTAPELSLEKTVGVDMVELDYASNDIVIFHDYFGLFVYDLNSLQIIRSLDLKPLNCHQTQGDNYCDVSVSMDGNTVQLHPMSSENMFIYTVSSNTLQESAYKPIDNPFRSQFISIEKVINSTKLGNYSHHAVHFDTGEYGYLHTEDGTIGTLSYVRGDKVFRLFDIKASLSDRRQMVMVNDILYRQSGEKINELPPEAVEIGMLESVLHNRNEIPERNFQGAMLDEKYAGNLLYQKKNQDDKLYLEDLSGYYIVFEKTELTRSNVLTFAEYLYTNPVASFNPDGPGYLYMIKENSFSVIDKKTGEAQAVSPLEWNEQIITDSEWEAMFNSATSIPDKSRMRYNSKTIDILSDKYRLFDMDGEIWVAQMNEDKIRCLYSLKPSN
jgi:hypothetical protein